MEELIKEFATLYTLTFKHYFRNGYPLEEIDKYAEAIGKEGTLTTYGEALNNLMSVCHSEILLKRMWNLACKFDEVSCYRFEVGYSYAQKLTPLEYRLNNIMLKTSFKCIQNDMSLKDASIITGVPETTIKQACQQERLINVSKVGKIWLVNLNEVKEYWEINK